MKPLILADFVRAEHSIAKADGVLLDFIPFRKNSVTEADAKQIRSTVSQNALRFGFFDRPSLNQLLYLLSEDLINGAVIANIGEKDLRRVAETTGRPLFLDGTCKPAEAIEKEQRMPIFGHFFQTPPDEEVLEILTKPYILSVNDPDTVTENLPLLRKVPPYALNGEDLSVLNDLKVQF